MNCPRCNNDSYAYRSRPVFKCKACGHQFSATSGTWNRCAKHPIKLEMARRILSQETLSTRQLALRLSVEWRTANEWRRKIEAEHAVG